MSHLGLGLLLHPTSTSVCTETGTHFNSVGTMYKKATELPEKACKRTRGSQQSQATQKLLTNTAEILTTAERNEEGT